MLKRKLIPIVATVGLALSTAVFAQAQSDATPASPTSEVTTMTPTKTGYAPVNGIDLYYEVYGSGEPLILLHGGVGAIEMFGPVLPMLAQGRQVIGVDLQGHGRTALGDRPMTFTAMADDVAELISYLGFKQADVMGYSLGGDVALRTAIDHPDMVRKLVLVSTPFKTDGWYPDVFAGMGQMNAAAAEPMHQTPMYQLYASIAPKPEDFPVLLTRLGDLLRQTYDWSKDIPSIKAQTMLVVGDADAIPTAHTAEFYELLGGGQKDGGWDGAGMSPNRLAILPGLTHYSIFMSPELASSVIPFLDAPVPQAKS